MNVMYESRKDVYAHDGKLRSVQGKAEILPEPVLVGDSFVDGTGASIYGTVLKDGGRYRMWYQAWPKNWDGHDVAYVGYAESDDGLSWIKPALGLVEAGPGKNNLCNLGFHSPSVFIDPKAAPDRRYRATGHVSPNTVGGIKGVKTAGYHRAYSADGLHWTLDGDVPRWPEADVITSIWHEGRGEPLVAFKRNCRVGGIGRRSIYTDTFGDEPYRHGAAALIPDEYDDVVSTTRGGNAADYYGMGMQPSGLGTIGFVWHFRHQLPRTPGGGQSGVFGAVDVGLAFQERPGDVWRNFYGRQDFIPHDYHPWMRGGVYTANRPTECGDEHRLYFTGTRYSHGWYISEQWKVLEDRRKQLIESGMSRIGLARWPAWRLFGLQADPEGAFTLGVCDPKKPFRIRLNYSCEPGGSVRVERQGVEGRTLDDAVPLEGDALHAVVRWRTGDVIEPTAFVGLRLHLDRATVWAWDVIPAGGTDVGG